MAQAAYKVNIRLAGDVVANSEIEVSAHGTDDTLSPISPSFNFMIKPDSNFIVQSSERNKNVFSGILHNKAVKNNYFFSTSTSDGYKTKISQNHKWKFTSVDLIPLKLIGQASSFSLNLSGDILDGSNFESPSFREKIYGLTDVSLTLDRFNIDNTFFTALNDRTRLLVSIQPDPANRDDVIYGWYKIESDSLTGELSGLETESLSLQLDGDPTTNFYWGGASDG